MKLRHYTLMLIKILENNYIKKYIFNQCIFIFWGNHFQRIKMTSVITGGNI